MAMQLVGREFYEMVEVFKNVWLPARAIVQRALESRFQVKINFNTVGTGFLMHLIVKSIS